MSVRLGELLTKATLISQDQLKEALRVQKDTGGKLGETLIKLGFVSEDGSMNNADHGPIIRHRLFGVSIGAFFGKNPNLIDTRLITR